MTISHGMAAVLPYAYASIMLVECGDHIRHAIFSKLVA
jgi:hypothetical protein